MNKLSAGVLALGLAASNYNNAEANTSTPVPVPGPAAPAPAPSTTPTAPAPRPWEQIVDGMKWDETGITLNNGTPIPIDRRRNPRVVQITAQMGERIRATGTCNGAEPTLDTGRIALTKATLSRPSADGRFTLEVELPKAEDNPNHATNPLVSTYAEVDCVNPSDRSVGETLALHVNLTSPPPKAPKPASVPPTTAAPAPSTSAMTAVSATESNDKILGGEITAGPSWGFSQGHPGFAVEGRLNVKARHDVEISPGVVMPSLRPDPYITSEGQTAEVFRPMWEFSAQGRYTPSRGKVQGVLGMGVGFEVAQGVPTGPDRSIDTDTRGFWQLYAGMRIKITKAAGFQIGLTGNIGKEPSKLGSGRLTVGADF